MFLLVYDYSYIVIFLKSKSNLRFLWVLLLVLNPKPVIKYRLPPFSLISSSGCFIVSTYVHGVF